MAWYSRGTTAKSLQALYSLGNELGRGNYGTVRSCVLKNSTSNSSQPAQPLACKSILFSSVRSPEDAAAVQMEIHMLETVAGHPHVVDLREVLRDGQGVHLIMERCDGDLFDELEKRERFSEAEAMAIFGQLANAVEHLHSKGIMHRDLKLENVLLVRQSVSAMAPDPLETNRSEFGVDFSEESGGEGASGSIPDPESNSVLDAGFLSGSESDSSGELRPELVLNPDLAWNLHRRLQANQASDTATLPAGASKPVGTNGQAAAGYLQVKLADFGLATTLGQGRSNDVAGSPYYLAPELLKLFFSQRARLINKERPYGLEVDIWSLGIILYSLFTGRFPYSGDDNAEIYRAIKRGILDLDSEHFAGVSKSAKALIRRLLHRDPQRRPTAREVLEDPWLAGYRRSALFSKSVPGVATRGCSRFESSSAVAAPREQPLSATERRGSRLKGGGKSDGEERYTWWPRQDFTKKAAALPPQPPASIGTSVPDGKANTLVHEMTLDMSALEFRLCLDSAASHRT